MQSQQAQEKKAEKTIEDALLTPYRLGIQGRNYILNDAFVNSTIFLYEGIRDDHLHPLPTNLEEVLYEVFEPFLQKYSVNNVIKVTKRDSGIMVIDIKNKSSRNVLFLDVFMNLHLDKPYKEVYNALKKHFKSDNKDMEARYFWL